MTIRSTVLLITLFLLFACQEDRSVLEDISSNPVVPTPRQVAYQQLELIGFIHFTVNTFTDKEWGYGDEDSSIFNPTELDVEQWVRVAKEAGMKELILTAKHHDGFCLWPSKYTEHSVKNSPYKDGQGDIVKEFTEACRKHGLDAGLYLSPWDRNHAAYGTEEYIIYYRNQLRELLTEYGEISEIWFDGANGGDGYYGGANEERRIDKNSYYDWPETIRLVKELQPNIMIFSDAGPDVHWIGNEHGFAGETFWSMLKGDSVVIGGADQQYLNTGDPQGDKWIVGQCDVSIRPGWFYHASQDSLVKTPSQLVDIFYKSVGRNSILLLNLPPDKRGLIHENDVDSLRQFRQILDESFADNLAAKATITASSVRMDAEKFSPSNLLQGDLSTYWAADDSLNAAEVLVDLGTVTRFDRIALQEPIQFGQRISSFEVQVASEGDQWATVFTGTTIGLKRLLRFPEVEASQIKVRLLEFNNTPALAHIAVYKASEKEQWELSTEE